MKMSTKKELTREIISKFAVSKEDTGSSVIQIALFTRHISNLTEHLKVNKKDYQARKGLLSFVIKRKRLLIYLKNNNDYKYNQIIKELKLKKV
jgi:small subunit ribosomal protein S15